MNERIRELAIQSGANVRKFKYQSTISVAFDDESFEKFAELIVKECCGAADDWYQKHNELHWDPAQHIRNHFGVEE